MKHYNIVTIALLTLSLNGCQQTIDVEKEKAAIMALLQEEGEAFVASDLKRIKAVHTGNDQDIRLAVNGNRTDQYKGWEEIKPLYEGYFKSPFPGENVKNSKDNVIITVLNDAAWLVCDNIWSWQTGGKHADFTNVQVAFFEKQNGNWKTAFNAFLPKREADKVEGIFQYLPPIKGQAVNRNGQFVYLFGPADGKGPMISQAGYYELNDGVVKNTISHSTDPKQVGTAYFWRVKSLAGDTLTYETLTEKGEVNGGGRAVRVSN